MFEDQTPSNLPTGPAPEDIFEKIEPAPTSAMPKLQSGEPALVVPSDGVAEIKAPLISSRKVIVIAGGVLGALAVAGIVCGVVRFVRRAAVLPPSAPAESVPSASETESVPEIPTLPSPEPISETPEVSPEEASSAPLVPTAPATPPDADNDGLSDEEEVKQGSDPNNPDSDNDGLFDGEEITTYQTDPLNSDTDGDTYPDGQEVRNGYNPKGEGKLFTVPSQ